MAGDQEVTVSTFCCREGNRRTLQCVTDFVIYPLTGPTAV